MTRTVKPSTEELVAARDALSEAVNEHLACQFDRAYPRRLERRRQAAELFVAVVSMRTQGLRPGQVVGIKANSLYEAELFAQHQLTARGVADVLTGPQWFTRASEWPDGIQKMFRAGTPRHYVDPLPMNRTVVWEDGSFESYDAQGIRKYLKPTPEALREGSGRWVETWFDHTGTELNAEQVQVIGQAAGVL